MDKDKVEQDRRRHLLARMAGNIAAGAAVDAGGQRGIAVRAVQIARMILEELEST